MTALSPVAPSTPGTRLAATLGRLTLISLPSRQDRRREFAAQLRQIGLSYDSPEVSVFDAIRPDDAGGFPTIGTRGCYLSHLGVLRAALERGDDQILICEDDLNFSADLPARAGQFAAEMAGQPWDIFYGFCPEGHGRPLSGTMLCEIPPGQSVICAHIYAVRRPALEKLVPYLEAILTREPGDPAGGPMHVDGAFSRFRAEHPELRTLAVGKPLGYQRFSATNIHDLGWKDRLPVVKQVMSVARRFRNRQAAG